MRFPFLKPTTATRRLSRGASLLTAAAIVAGSLAWYGAVPAHADTVAPGMPINVRLSPSPVTTDGTVVVTWDAPADTDLAYYQVFRFSGSATADATEVTYLGRTQDTRNYFIDTAPTEGVFQYAVIAVDSSGNAGLASAWSGVTVDFPANGAGTIQADQTAPPTPGSFHAGAAYAQNRTVSLGWTQSAATDLWRYIIYREDAADAVTAAGYAGAAATTFTDTVQADGAYRYYVVAQDKTGNVSAASTTAAVTVDNTAPVVAITAPIASQTYARSGSLTIVASVTEDGAGYEASAVKYYLDNVRISNPTLNLATLTQGTHTVKVTVTDRAGNTGTHQVQFSVGTVATNPNAPHTLTAPTYSKSRLVALTWSAPTAGTVTSYTVYRADSADGTPVVAGSTLAAVTQFTDTVPADGIYSYYVVAQNGSVASPESNIAISIVDTVAPSITVAAPAAGHTYEQSGTLPVDVTVTDALSGYDTARVKSWLDGTAFTGSAIDLASLAQGSHTFKVEAADRAGNVRIKSVAFSVGTPSNGDDDDDDDHGDRPANQQLIDLLISLRSQIQHGHYTALMAKARSGHIREFTQHLMKFRGKFIAPEAADKLLEAVGAQVQTWDRADRDEHESKGHGKKW